MDTVPISYFLSGISIAALMPTILNFNEESNYPFKSKINLGLDLQGGLYMILGIDFRKVYADEVKGYARKVEYIAKDQKGIEVTVGDLVVNDEFDPMHTVRFKNSEELETTVDLIHQFYQGTLRITGEEGNVLTIGLTKTLKTQIEEQSVGKSIEVIRNRIDEFGVTEPEILSQGDDRIIVQLPGVKDIDRAKELIGKTARLEFKMVNDDFSAATLQGLVDQAKAEGIEIKKGVRFSDYLAKVNDFAKKDLPEGYEIAFEKRFQNLITKLKAWFPIWWNQRQELRVMISRMPEFRLINKRMSLTLVSILNPKGLQFLKN